MSKSGFLILKPSNRLYIWKNKCVIVNSKSNYDFDVNKSSV